MFNLVSLIIGAVALVFGLIAFTRCSAGPTG